MQGNGEGTLDFLLGMFDGCFDEGSGGKIGRGDGLKQVLVLAKVWRRLRLV